MNILICSNYNFIYPTGTMMYSLQKNNNCKITFIYVHFEDYDYKKTFTSLKKYCLKPNEIIRISVPLSPLFKMPSDSRWGKEVYLKMIVPYHLPKNINEFLYIDGDIIVNDNIEEDYYNCLNSKVALLGQEERYVNSLEAIRKMPIRDDMYFNGGFMFINTKLYKSKYKTFESIVSKMNNCQYECPFNEQDMLSYLFDGYKMPFPKALNMLMCWDYSKEKYKIYHFAGSRRPWSTKTTAVLYRDIFWKYGKHVFPLKIRLLSTYSYIKIILKSKIKKIDLY